MQKEKLIGENQSKCKNNLVYCVKLNGSTALKSHIAKYI